MPVVATILPAAILLWVGSHPAQLLFQAAWERLTAQNPPEIYTYSTISNFKYKMYNLGRNHIRIISQMHFYELSRVQKQLLNSAMKSNKLGYCYKAVGGTTI